MNLPQELLDDIIRHIPLEIGYDVWTLRNCSLVAKSWANPSQRRLFETVKIREKTLQLWLAKISSTNEGLLQHVRSLSYVLRATDLRSDPDILRDYLPSFNQLQHLCLSTVRITLAQQVEIFSAFQHTLSRLSLDHCTITISALVTLINYFPHLDRLDISNVSHEPSSEPTPPRSRPIPKLHISDFHGGGDARGLFAALSRNGLVFDEIIVEDQFRLPALILYHIFGTVGANAKHLRLWRSFENLSLFSEERLLAPCKELRELEIVVKGPRVSWNSAISSITSTKIKKITFVWIRHLDGLPGSTHWEAYAHPLCLLADRLGSKHKLEVEFRLMDEGVEAMTIVDSLAEFGEKGHIRVIRVGLDGGESITYPLSRER